jgi:hypothetical protein
MIQAIQSGNLAGILFFREKETANAVAKSHRPSGRIVQRQGADGVDELKGAVHVARDAAVEFYRPSTELVRLSD